MIEIKKVNEVREVVYDNEKVQAVILTNDVESAFEAITDLYSASEVVMGEFLETIALPLLSTVEVVDLYAKCMMWAENDVVLHLNVEDGFVFVRGDGATDDYLAEICQFVGNHKKVKYTEETVSLFNEYFTIEVSSLASQRFIPAFTHAGDYDDANVYGDTASFMLCDAHNTELLTIDDKAVDEVAVTEKLLCIFYACDHNASDFIEKIQQETF